MKSPRFFLVLVGVLAGALSSARAEAPSSAPKRPRIIGLSHAAFYVTDMAKTRAFYENFLGFAEPFSVPRNKGGDLVWIKINDRQTVELFPASELPSPDADRLYHVALEVEDAEAMRVYLKAKGVEVPDQTPVGKIGNANFFIKDPEGHIVEIVEYRPQGWTRREQGKFLPDTRISQHLRHAGVMVGRLEPAMKFYRDILGLQEFWRGSANGIKLSWVNMRLPESDDYIEFMLYDQTPPPERVRTAHHICLEVDDVAKVGALLQSRQLPAGCKPPTEMKIGVNGKRQINYYDPDGTRVEIMEPNTTDGKPVPSSTAPAPGEPGV